MIRLPGHITRPGDAESLRTCGKRYAHRKSMVGYRFHCKCQVKFYDGKYYMTLARDVRGQHNE
jgi:hypothetical protein